MIYTEYMEYNYDESIIHDLSPEKQCEEMLKWFESRYEDPVHHCPVKHGEYIYIYGGPYTAIEVLISEFEKLVPSDVIKNLADELDSQCDWSAKEPKDWRDDYDIDYIDDIILDKDSYNIFNKSIENINSLLLLDCDGMPQSVLYKILYVNIITSLETYLSETFIINLFESGDAIENFLKNNNDLIKNKFTLTEIWKSENIIEESIKKYLASVMWHNLGKIQGFYYSTFEIKFPDNLQAIFEAIENRHDIVHRNGKNINGEELAVSKNDVQELASKISEFVENIEAQIKEYKEKNILF